MSRLAVVVLACVSALVAQSTVSFPADVVVGEIVGDGRGGLYAAGSRSGKAFLARVTAGVIVELPVQTPSNAPIIAVAADSTASVYVAGTELVEGRPSRAFVQKYEESGRLVFSTSLPGSASTSVRSLVLTATGDLLLNGQVVGEDFLTTAGAPGGSGGGYLVRFNAQGELTLAVRGVGIGHVAVGRDNSIYVAGVEATLPPTPGAFQTTYTLNGCAGSGLMGIACAYQHVTKLRADGLQVLWATFVTGSFGATPTAMHVNAAGEVTVAGWTNSSDYPVTPGTVQPQYRATSTRKVGMVGVRPPIVPPPQSGFLSRLRADGSGLVWSTFFSGTGADSVVDLEIDSSGELLIAGYTASPDLPGIDGIARGCTPLLGRELPFVARLSPDASRLLNARIEWDLSGDGSLKLAEGLAAAQRAIALRPSSAAACLLDPADWTLQGHLVDGQVLSLFGRGFDAERPSVKINGAAVEVLYAATDQINLQLPSGISGRDPVLLQVVSGSTMVNRYLPVLARAPSAFLVSTPFDVVNPGVSCGIGMAPAYQPLAHNEGGGWNTCETPARPGELVTVYLNGVGPGSPSFSLRFTTSWQIEIAERDPDSPPGVWRLRLRVPAGASTTAVEPLVDGTPLRRGSLAIWVAR